MVCPCWPAILVPLFVVDEAVDRIKDGTITNYVYDPKAAAGEGGLRAARKGGEGGLNAHKDGEQVRDEQ